jgi:signal transduction histidine kinase
MTVDGPNRRLAASHRTAIDIGLFVLAYGTTAAIGLWLRMNIGSTTLWVSNGVLVAGLLLLDRRARPLFLLLATLAALATGPLVLGKLTSRYASYLLLNSVESAAIAWATARICGPRLDFSQWRQLAALTGLAVVPISLATAVFGAEVMRWLGMTSVSAAVWFESHALASTVVVPAITILYRPQRYRSFSFSKLELFGALCAFAVFAVGVFVADYTLPLLFLMFPAMMLLAFRYGPVGAAWGVLTVGGLALFFTFSVPGVLGEAAGLGFLSRVQLMQAFLVVLLVTALPVAGAVATSARMRLLLARRSLVARQARQKAERASMARAEFLANMSHEIRTPLNGVLGLADALWRTDLKAEQREMLKMILASGQALTGLLSDALDLARADSGAMEIAQERFIVRDLIREAAFPFEHMAQSKGLRFETAVEDDVPPAGVGDPLRIRQILANLISNAIKFTSDGEVRLTVACESGLVGQSFLKVEVCDTGIGLDPDMKSRLFRRFEQADTSVTRRYGGCGLGLSIAHKLGEMMGGSLECESELGQGSTFTLRLPLIEATAGVAEAATPEEPSLDRKLKVLLAEDHLVNQKVVEIMLNGQVELTIVDHGRAAIEAVRTQTFDVVLMDTHMPVMDGLTAMRAIREWELLNGRPRVPIVSLTADAMPQQVAAAEAAGADLHLSKPITGEGLVRVLQESQQLGRGGADLAKAS